MLREKMLAVMDEVNQKVAERAELIRYIAIALLARKNLFILGGTGQAKSYAIDLFRKRIAGAKQFKRTLSKGSDEEQLFGRLDLASLLPGGIPSAALQQDSTYWDLYRKAEAAHEAFERNRSDESYIALQEAAISLGQYRQVLGKLHQNLPSVITTGKIPESHIVFLDEIFKANDGLLNSLLTALNEREYTNEGTTIRIPAISFFAASNEIPNFSDPAESILRPLYDRFELKVVTQYVQDRGARLAMLAAKQSEEEDVPQASIALEELSAMQEEAAQVRVPVAVNEVMDGILCQLRRKGIQVSDRKYFGFAPIVQAQAWLEGRSEVLVPDLLILSAYLWNTVEELPQVKAVLAEICENPLGERLDSLRAMTLEAYEAFQQDYNSVGVKAIRKFREDLLVIYQQFTGLQGESRTDGDASRLSELLDLLEEKNKAASDAAHFTYVPLSEMAQLPN